MTVAEARDVDTGEDVRPESERIYLVAKVRERTASGYKTEGTEEIQTESEV